MEKQKLMNLISLLLQFIDEEDGYTEDGWRTDDDYTEDGWCE